MRRSANRLSVFGLALILQALVNYLLGPPPDGRPTWMAWALAQSRQLASLPPRLRVFAPFAASLVIIRAAAVIERSRPAGGGRLLSILIQAAVLALTFDLWRGVRASDAVQRQMANAPLDAAGKPVAALDSERIEAEIGRLANAPSESVVGPWAAYAAFDLSGAVAYAAVESLGGPMAGPGTEGPLTAMLDPARRLVSVRRGRDAIAAAATLAARGRSDLQPPELEELALGSETPDPGHRHVRRARPAHILERALGRLAAARARPQGSGPRAPTASQGAWIAGPDRRRRRRHWRSVPSATFIRRGRLVGVTRSRGFAGGC